MIVDLAEFSADDLLHLSAAKRLREERQLADLRQVVEDLLTHFDPVAYATAISDVVELRCARFGLPFDLALREVLRPALAPRTAAAA